MNNNLLSIYSNYVNNSNNSIQDIIIILRNQQITFDSLIRFYINNDSQLPTPPSLSNNPFSSFTTIPIPPSFPRQTPLNQTFSATRPPFSQTISMPPSRTTGARFSSLFNDPINNEIMEPVPIQPNPSQLYNAIKTIKFSEIEDPLNFFCPISQLDFSGNDEVIQLISCKHIFTPSHILQWFERNVKCPLCRADIRDVSGNSNSNLPPNSNNIISRINHALTRHFNNNEGLYDSSNNLTIEIAINDDLLP